MNIARQLTALTGLAYLSVFSAACGMGADDDSAKAKVEVINQTKSAITAGGLSQINGTYGGGCDGRSGAWSARISGSADLIHPALSVRLNDDDCVLTVTELIANDGTTDFDASPAIAMAETFGSASQFLDDTALKFYGVARISDATYAGNFTMTVLISDEPYTGQSGAKSGSFAQAESTSVQSTNVAPSDYAVDTSGFGLNVDVDNVVSSTTGSAALSGSVAGEEYTVTETNLDSQTFEQVDDFWAGVSSPTVMSGLTPTIPHTAFDLVGDDLASAPSYRWVVIRRAEDGVPSYQIIKFTFGKPGGY